MYNNQGFNIFAVQIVIMSRELSEQESVRRESLQKIKDMGVDPYPAELFEVNCTAQEIHDNYEKDKIC